MAHSTQRTARTGLISVSIPLLRCPGHHGDLCLSSSCPSTLLSRGIPVVVLEARKKTHQAAKMQGVKAPQGGPVVASDQRPRLLRKQRYAAVVPVQGSKSVVYHVEMLLGYDTNVGCRLRTRKHAKYLRTPLVLLGNLALRTLLPLLRPPPACMICASLTRSHMLRSPSGCCCP